MGRPWKRLDLIRPGVPKSRSGYLVVLSWFLAKKIIALSSRGSNMVVDDPNYLNDPIQLMHGRAIHQLFYKNPIEIEDFIGAVYDDIKYIGRVIDKDDEKILVSYQVKSYASQNQYRARRNRLFFIFLRRVRLYSIETNKLVGSILS